MTTQTLSEFLATDQAAKTASDSITGVYGATANPHFGQVVTTALAAAAPADATADWLDGETATRVARAAGATIYSNGYERMFAMVARMDLHHAFAGLTPQG